MQAIMSPFTCKPSLHVSAEKEGKKIELFLVEEKTEKRGLIYSK